METSVKGFFLNRFSPSGIFAARDLKWRYALLQFIFISLLIAFPLSLEMYKIDGAAITKALFGNVLDGGEDWWGDFKDGVKNREFSVISVGRQTVVYTPNGEADSAFEDAAAGLEIHDEFSALYVAGFGFYGAFPDGFSLAGALDGEDAARALSEVAVEALTGLYAVLALLMYPLSALLNVIFVLIVAAMAMFLNFGAAVRFSFGGFVRFLCFAATLPAVFAALAGMVGGVAFVYLTYNFGLIFWAYLVYREGQKSFVKRVVSENVGNENVGNEI